MWGYEKSISLLTFFLATQLFSLAFIKTTFVWTGNLFCKYQWKHISENIVIKTNPISEICLLPDISLQLILWVFPVSLKYTLTWEIAYCLRSKKLKNPSMPLKNCWRVLPNKMHFPLWQTVLIMVSSTSIQLTISPQNLLRFRLISSQYLYILWLCFLKKSGILLFHLYLSWAHIHLRNLYKNYKFCSRP